MPKIPRQPDINIGTAGHVDHGKSTIVAAITGVWTSAHSEELRRGITIKVGYADAAFYKCPDCPSPQNHSTLPKCPNCKATGKIQRVVSFIDVPGHESLMANMLSGSALTDGAVLAIAANEKVPQPQTREHLLALEMLGSKQMVIAHNKVDLVGAEEAKKNYESIMEFISGTVAEKAPIIPISAQHNLNIDALIEAIELNIGTVTKDQSAPPLLQVLRSFDINKPGSTIEKLNGGVFGGSLSQGLLKIEDEVEIRPGVPNDKSGKYEPVMTSISSLGTGAGLMDSVKPGGLVAIGTRLDPSLTKSDSFVGAVIGHPGELPPILESLDMEVTLFDVAIGSPDMMKVEKIKHGEPLRLNVGTSVTMGLVSSVRDGHVSVNLRRPVSANSGSRLAISRRIAERWRLIGSGILS